MYNPNIDLHNVSRLGIDSSIYTNSDFFKLIVGIYVLYKVRAREDSSTSTLFNLLDSLLVCLRVYSLSDPIDAIPIIKSY